MSSLVCITGHYSSILGHVINRWLSSCRRPAASSRSLDPTDRPCCRTLSPPHTPGAPAGVPSPSPRIHLKQERDQKIQNG